MNGPEKRKYKRLGLELDLQCIKLGTQCRQSHSGRTINVSPGGLYFEINSDIFKPGNRVRVDMSVPPTSGLLESGGRMCAEAKVLRLQALTMPGKGTSKCYGVAVEFCDSPRLCM